MRKKKRRWLKKNEMGIKNRKLDKEQHKKKRKNKESGNGSQQEETISKETERIGMKAGKVEGKYVRMKNKREVERRRKKKIEKMK